MSSVNILKLNEFNSANLIVASPKPMGNMGGKAIAVNYSFPEGQAPITIQTSWMSSFGINKWEFPEPPTAPGVPAPPPQPPKLSVTLSFQGVDADPKMGKLRDVLSSIDEWAIDTVHKNSWDWLKIKNAPRDTIAFNYTRSFKYPVDKVTGEPNGKPAVMKLKLEREKSGDYKAAFFNKDRVLIPSADVESVFTMGSKVRAIFECNGFWVAAGKCGLTWRLKQLILDPTVRIGKNYAFNDDEDDTTPSVQAPKALSAPPASVPVAQLSNSDDEEDQGQGQEEAAVPEPEPEPVAPPKKATVIRRKVQQ